MSDRPTPETDAIVRNAATADHPPTRLAATLTVKCGKLERERDEAREAFVIATDQMVIAQGKVREANKERDEAREKLSAVWQSLRDSQDEVLRLTFENRELRNLSNE